MVRLMTCPICGKPVPPAVDPAASTTPFCSLRCKQVDFCRWNDGRYAIVEPLDPAKFAESMLDVEDPNLPSEENE